MEIHQLAILRKSLKSVGKAFGNQKAAEVLRRYNLSMPVQKRGRSGAQIHRYVKHRTGETAHDLHFGMRRKLKVHAANHALAACKRVIHLNNGPDQTGGPKFIGTEKAGEETARISEGLSLSDLDSRQWRIVKVKAPHAFRVSK
jgi:hypothetical protein